MQDLFGNAATSERQFYEQLFRSFDPQNCGTIQGGQVFGFFLSSGLNKGALGDIWDEATQKQSGGLSVAKFISAMKLISLAQRGIAPKLANVGKSTNVSPPQMQYPSHIKPPPTETTQQTPVEQQSSEPDPFGGLTSGLGFGDIGGGDMDMGTAAPSGPTWSANPIVETAVAEEVNDMTGMNMNGIMNGIDSDGTTENHKKNEFGPASHMAQHSHIGPTLTLTVREQDIDIDSETVAPPGLNRRISTKILYQEERLREQIRQAEQREKLAKKQANTQRIENERLERENEQLKLQINAARQAQANALSQSQQALTSIQPLRVENEKLKQAIAQWKELIQTKDEELEALEAEVDQLRLENEKLENVLRDDKSRVDDIQFKLERSDALLQELTIRNTGLEAQMHLLRSENTGLEDDRRNLDLKMAQMKDEMKKLKRNQNSGLGLSALGVKQKENDLFEKVVSRHDFNFSETATAVTTVEPGHGTEIENTITEIEIDVVSDSDGREPDYIEQETTEEIEVFEDVTTSVLFDSEYEHTLSEWYMSSSDVANYHKYFVQADTNKDGAVDGNEANKFFTKSKLNRKVLAKIWVLADQHKQGKLSEHMFCTMFHLVMKIKKSGNKLSVPNQLPACLTESVVAQLGSTVEKTVKEKKIISQKKIIKIQNPNKKHKKSKAKVKSSNSNDDFGAGDWGNDFSFDTRETNVNNIMQTPQKEENAVTQTQTSTEVTGATATDATDATDDNWNTFDNFFNQ